MAILTKNDQQRIDEIIDDVSQRLGVSYPDNSLIDFANKAEIKVLETDLHSIKPTLSGVILYKDPVNKTNPTIFIDKSMSQRRKTFTLAHELGHHFMHEGTKLRLDDLDYENNDINTKQESEANYFAASLLVPKDLLNKKLEENLDLDSLAEYFHVSLPVIRNRLKWIKVN